jgi:D-3-phosphoglycerate dehydrogenase
MKHEGDVLIAAPVHPVLPEGLEAAGYRVKMMEVVTPEAAIKAIADCTGLITSNRLQMGRDMLDAAPALKWIGRMGSGMEIIDTDYARQKGIRCFSSPGGNANAVAEHAVGMLLALTKKINRSYIQVRQGIWQREANRGIELEGKTLGIVGFGHTGRALAGKLQAFDMRLLAYDIKAGILIPDYVAAASLAEIQQQADIVSFHVPYTRDTHHYFDREFLYAMQKPFFLINTSRGAIADTSAILEGIEKERIAGAALDVVEGEPSADTGAIQQQDLLLLSGREEVLITPHIAGYSQEAVYKMSKILLDKLLV